MSRRVGVTRRLLAPSGAVVAALWLAVWFGGVLDRAELTTVDWRFAVRGAQPVQDAVVVAIDDRTLDELRERPPLRRSLHARVIDQLRRARVRLIAYDVQFTEPTDPAEDAALLESVDRARPVVLAASEVDEQGRSNVFGGVETQRDVGARVGSTNFVVEPGGTFRRLPYAVDGLESFAVVAAATVRGRPVPRAGFGDRGAWIDFAGPPSTVPTVSFSDVLRGSVPAGRLRGRIAVVGATAPTLQDVHPTSTTGDDLMSGAEIQANAIRTLLRGVPLRSAPGALGTLLIVGAGLAVPLAALWLRPRAAAAVWGGLTVALLALAQLAFGAGLIVPVIHPLAALATGAVAALGLGALGAALERERTRLLFARFVPEPVVEDVLARTDDRGLLGGVRRDGTVMFADLRGFTSLAERLPPDRVIEVLNHYLGEMSDAVMSHGGTLVSYMGDGIMAVFGAPLEQPDHADRALGAAREMLEMRLPRFVEWLREAGVAESMRMGIGLNSGEVMSGHVGSEQRIEYAAVGDATNTAARVEAMTRDRPHQLLLSGETRDRLVDPPPDLVRVGEAPVRGRSAPVALWTLAGADEPTPAPERPGTAERAA